jgi:hypothetical protein
MWADTQSDTGLPPELLAEVNQRFPELEKERAQVMELSKGLRQKHYDGGAPADWSKADPSQCAEKAGRLEDVIVADLDAGIPIGVTADIGDLDAWSTRGKAPAWHAFLLIGYSRYPDGRIQFKTRNSWAGLNPGVWGHELCRIGSLDKVLTPSESPSR